MRMLLLIVSVTSWMVSPVRADDSPHPPDADEKFYEMFTEWAYKDGLLDVLDWEDSKTWINGVRQNVVDIEYLLKPGDVVESFSGANDEERVLRYRLNRLTPQRAVFTRWIFAAIRFRNDAGLWEHRRGALKLTDSFTLDLTQPNGLLIDYGPNHVISSGQKTARSK